MESPLKIKNIRLFILFKVLFNSRFYYPVFTILFLDFGLSVAQFSILNAVWAATIVLLEVPSGALADILGRRRLLVAATTIMMFEIGVIAFVPTHNPTLVFWVFLFNRICSGLAEAAASGADEAIAYDSLVAQGDPDQWGRVLEVMMRFQSIGFIIAMSTGAAMYDPRLLESLFSIFGASPGFTQETTMRIPLYATLVLAVLAWLTTLQLKDPQVPSQKGQPDRTGQVAPDSHKPPSLAQAFRLTWHAGLWICRTPFALAVILFGMMFDGVVRMVITLSSQYYRMVQLPESVFGLLGSMVAILGLIIPKIAKSIAENRSPAFGLWLTAALTATGLSGMSFFWPYIGLFPALVTFGAMYFTGFFVSYHINRITSSEQRATVLSFKGLAYNISYGLLGVMYALLLKAMKDGVQTIEMENMVFMDTFWSFPALFGIWFLCLLVVYFLFLKPRPSI